MKRSILLLSAMLLAGCASVDVSKHTENRVTTTLDCGRAFFTSLWGPVGITSEIDSKDAAQLPCAKRVNP